MKEVLSTVLAVLLIMTVSSVVFAEEPERSMMGKEMMQGSMMDPEDMMQKDMMTQQGKMMGKGKMMGMGSMCGMMMNKSLVATSDGSVVVLIGSKLQKYDKDLVLKKEVEIKLDMESMQKMMKRMMGKCPMRKKMMQEGGMLRETTEESEETTKSEETSKHEVHH